METINFIQIVPLSREEKIKMYMKLTKKQLAEMMAMRDEIEEHNDKPIQPYVPDMPKFPKCTSWSDCTNIFKDCINCPLRYNSGDTISISKL